MNVAVRSALQRINSHLIPSLGAVAATRVLPTGQVLVKQDGVLPKSREQDTKLRSCAVSLRDLLYRDDTKASYKLPSARVVYIVPLRHTIHAILDKTLPCATDDAKLDPTFGVPEVREPVSTSIPQEKQAARLIKIRRKKMKKHKLRKLRKKMFYVWAKVRQRREARKEKAFIDEQLTKIEASDNFNAKEWVVDVIRKSTTDPATLIKPRPKRERPTRYVL